MTELIEGCTHCGSDEHNTTDCRWLGQLAVSEVIAEENARPIPPAVAEYAVSALHTAPSDGVRVAELELLNAGLWRKNEALTQRLAGGGETLEVVATIECLDESTAYIESRSKRINVDNAVYNDALVFESDARAIIAQRDARIEEQAREIRAMQEDPETYLRRLANAKFTLKPEQPSGVDELDASAERNAMQRQRDQAIKQLARECDDTDSFIRMVGLDPDQLRTDGGFLNLAKARAALTASAPNHSEQVREGWQPVPVKPTEEMLDELTNGDAKKSKIMKLRYAAMLLAAAPSAGSQGGE